MKEKFKIAHMKVAKIYSELSYCVRKKVGCIIVKDNRVVSIGFNGTPPGEPNVCENFLGFTLDTVIHAEKNAIIKIQNDIDLINNSILFVTTCPCLPCAKLIVDNKISEVYYNEDYRIDHGLKFLIKQGVKVEKIIL